ncbi:MAG: prepilin-type N-terminal cleavage/methylation domain-containing protein [Gemmatimonadota bacterium]|nr:prepilin-type N-terminal cleavage/methylation domain-containing protein [Gemmatimonadota bacterium]HEU4989955.1 type II secretion system protein [Gemmatimonadaceae bacterium]
MPTRRAATLVELLVVLAMTAALFALVEPPVAAGLDRAAVRGASRDAERLFASAREQALARDAPVWVVIDSARSEMRLRVPGTGTWSRPLGSVYGVALWSTRDSMSYDGRGLGWGAANLTVVFARGRARDTLVVSRLGRVRR